MSTIEAHIYGKIPIKDLCALVFREFLSYGDVTASREKGYTRLIMHSEEFSCTAYLDASGGKRAMVIVNNASVIDTYLARTLYTVAMELGEGIADSRVQFRCGDDRYSPEAYIQQLESYDGGTFIVDSRSGEPEHSSDLF
jgi:hypothetical protein